jgi:3-oxoacyl-[acyl-carrier protein] reductase
MGNLLDGHIALLTGGGSGIGRAIARGYAAEGATVIAADANADSAAETAKLIADAGGTGHAYGLDVTDRQACDDLAVTVSGEVGAVSVLVNNAGIVRRSTMETEAAVGDWEDVLAVNLDGPFNVSRAFLADLIKTKGRVINIGSIQSMIHARTSIAYTVSKGAVMNLSKAMAGELGPKGIRVNTIGPGLIRTPLNAEARSNSDHEPYFIGRTPLRRVGEPEDIVGPAVFLASDMSGYVTGAYLPVDGGFLIN